MKVRALQSSDEIAAEINYMSDPNNLPFGVPNAQSSIWLYTALCSLQSAYQTAKLREALAGETKEPERKGKS